EIDTEVQNFINYCYDRAKTILTEHKDKLELIAQTLLEVETLDAKQIRSLFEHGVLPEEEDDSDDTTSEPSAYEDVRVKTKSETNKNTQPETCEEAKRHAEEKMKRQKEEQKEQPEQTDAESSTKDDKNK